MSGAFLAILADTSIRASVAALLVAAVLAIVRARSGAVRHAAWTAVLFAMLLMPVLTRWTPAIVTPFSVPLPAFGEHFDNAAREILPEHRGPQRAAASSGVPPDSAGTSTPSDISVLSTEFAAPLTSSPGTASTANFWLLVICAVYGIVAAAMMARFFVGWWGAVRVARGSQAVNPVLEYPPFLSSDQIDVRESRIVAVPVTVGLLRQTILLPVAWRRWPVETLHAVLAHEMAHIRRKDVPVTFAAHLNRCVLWFHPLSWWLERTLAATAEQAADEVAMSAIEDRAAYASILIQMARGVADGRGRIAWFGVGIDSSRLLNQRIERALSGSAAADISAVRKAILGIACVSAVLIAVACRPSEVSARDNAAREQGDRMRASDVTLASRLAWFLWNSDPDEELVAVANNGKLNDRATLDQQVQRMLRDTRSSALISNVFNAWLHLRNLPTVRFDPVAFPDFDDSLLDAFARETELFLASQLHENQSAVQVLTANYTFLNERLARHYRIAGVTGSDFRRVTFEPDSPRRGLLGHGSILAVTSYHSRTSPVVRGKWMLDVLLGRPTTAATVNMPRIREDEPGKPTSLRLRMDLQSKNPECARCHAWIDPLGFALENFDATGQWRTSEGNTLINSSAALPDGTEIDGPAGVRQYLVNHRAEFVGAVVAQLMTYAIGRGGDYTQDIRTIVNDAAGSNYRWSSLILGIVRSTPFQTGL